MNPPMKDPHDWQPVDGYEIIDVVVCKNCCTTKVTDKHGVDEYYPKIDLYTCDLKHVHELQRAYALQLSLTF